MYLDVGDGHRLYVAAEKGSQRGTQKSNEAAAVFLHGGPGGSSSPSHEQFFPERVRLVRFDQRGCGRSKFTSRLKNNTTWHLVADLEAIRRELGIAKWLLFGGSWGSTLGLCYAIKHPERVSGLVLRGVFLGGDDEWDWAFSAGAKMFRPQLAETLRRFGTVAQLERRILGGDVAAAKAWAAYERGLSTLVPLPFKLPTKPPNSPLLETHYHRHKFFLQPNWILKNLAAARRLPLRIIQGRYDLICPPLKAYQLAKAWGAKCRLELTEAGHDAFEPPTAAGLRRAVEALL